MTPPASAAAPWMRVVPEAGGRWRRRAVDAMLRLNVRGKLDATGDLATMRAFVARADARLAWREPGMRRTGAVLGSVACEWVDVQGSRPERVILYLHGSAFAFRMPATHAGLVARLCSRLGARAIIPDYRLAPEHPFPAAIDDCTAAYDALVASGVEPSRIVLAGDSAGGTLALALLLRNRSRGVRQPACAVAMSAVADFTLTGTSVVRNAKHDAVFTLAALVGWRAMYAPPERFLDPDVSPLFGDFAGLPPLLLQVGGQEMLQDESTRVAAKAHAAGVDVELEVYERMQHVFQAMPLLAQSHVALDAIAAFVRRRARWPD